MAIRILAATPRSSRLRSKRVLRQASHQSAASTASTQLRLCSGSTNPLPTDDVSSFRIRLGQVTRRGLDNCVPTVRWMWFMTSD